MSDQTETPQKRRIPVLVLLPVVVFAALAALFLFQLTLGEDPHAIPSALIGKKAPETDLPPVAGLTNNGTARPRCVHRGPHGQGLRCECLRLVVRAPAARNIRSWKSSPRWTASS